MIKAAFFDIDGTLVSFKTHTVPDSARNAVNSLRAAGVRCFISSGRHISNIDNLGDLEFDGYVTVNGGITIMDGVVVDANPIAPSDVRRMMEMIAKGGEYEDMAVSFVMRDGLIMNTENDKTEAIFRQLKFNKMPRIVNVEEILGNEAEKADVFQMISFFGEDDEPHILSQLPNCQSARWSPIFSDMVPKGQSKVRGMQKVIDALGIAQEETIAFGDGGNDIEMLRWAGTGVAMGGAADTVKKEADMTCPDVDEDGIAWAVEKILKNR